MVKTVVYLLVITAAVVTPALRKYAMQGKPKKRAPFVISARKDERAVESAWNQNALGSGLRHGRKAMAVAGRRAGDARHCARSDRSGKNTLLKNIITQDVARLVGPREDRHHIPMVIFDGKGDLEFFVKHQLNYLGDIVRVLYYTDEFAPFGYRNFAQILQMACDTNTAFLFSMQSLARLMQVGRGFKEEVTSAPNTTMTLRTQDEETAKYFIKASAEQVVTGAASKRSGFFGLGQYEETGRATESEDRETRSQDEPIKNVPKGEMEILMSDDKLGTLHTLLQVCRPRRCPSLASSQCCIRGCCTRAWNRAARICASRTRS